MTQSQMIRHIPHYRFQAKNKCDVVTMGKPSTIWHDCRNWVLSFNKFQSGIHRRECGMAGGEEGQELKRKE